MTIEIRYLSLSGNTSKLANSLAEYLDVTAYDVNYPVRGEIDLLFLGGAIYAGNINNELISFIKRLDKNVKNIALFSTAAGPKGISKIVKKHLLGTNIHIYEHEFHCQGKFLFFNRKRPNAKDLQDVRDYASSVIKDLENKGEKL
jgi:flavodoxin